jgi:hypothetical protein
VKRRRRQGGAVARWIGGRFGRRQRRPDPARRKQSGLIGRDLARMRERAAGRSRMLSVALIGALMAALCLTALRIDLIRQGYDLGAAMREERELLERHRVLTARVRRLRDPARLARLANDMGFERPVRVIELGAPDVPAGPRP